MTQHQYSIAPSDMAFHALTTSLYKDRLRAPVREILSNSIDSQNRLGHDRAIEIKLPTALDTQFRIRDYGSGLSKDDMQRLYSSLFSSDKHLTRPNEVGGFGVGAKSPFAYTDVFTVESYYNGKHTVYSAFMDGNRAPQLLELFEQDTDQPNGLAVSYPVAKEDVPALIQAVRQEVAICGHAVDCTGSGEPIVALEKNPKFQKVGGAWLGSDSSFLPKTQSSNGYYDSKVKSYVRMGNVVYPLSQERSSLKELETVRTLLHHALLGGGEDSFFEFRRRHKKNTPPRDWNVVIFEAPIASVRPAMSREELVLNDPLTIKGLMAMHVAALQGIYQHAIEANNSAECVRLLKDYKTALSPKSTVLPKGWDKELEIEIAQLEAVAEATEQTESLWKPNAMMVHPRFIEMLAHETRGGFGGHFGGHPAHMMGAFMPLMYGSRNAEVSLDTPDTTLVMIPHTHAGLLEMIHGMAGTKDFGYGRKSPMRPHDLADLMQTLGKLGRQNLDEHYFGDVLLLSAQSKENEEQLYQLVREHGKTLHVLDIPNRSINAVKPVASVQPAVASPMDPSNPYKAPTTSAEPFIAHYWDVEASKVVKTTLTEVPLYCVANGYDEENMNVDEKILCSWQKVLGPNHTLYAVPKEHLAEQDRRNGLSRALQDAANASVRKDDVPTSFLEWTMAAINLPQAHPLYRQERVQYVQAHQLLSELRRYCMEMEYNYSSRRYTDYGWDEEAKLGFNPTYDAQLLKTYPLLEAFSRERCDPTQLDALTQYIALVDRTHGHDYSAPSTQMPAAPSLR